MKENRTHILGLMSSSLNQDLTFKFAKEFFIKNNLQFEENNKRTLKLINEDGYYTNAALLLSDQCEHSIKCAVYEGTGKMKFKARTRVLRLHTRADERRL